MPRSVRTVEIPLINLHRDKIVKEVEELTRFKTGLTAAYRTLMEEVHKTDIEFTNLSVLVAAQGPTLSQDRQHMDLNKLSNYGEPSSSTNELELNLNPDANQVINANTDEEFDSD